MRSEATSDDILSRFSSAIAEAGSEAGSPEGKVALPLAPGCGVVDLEFGTDCRGVADVPALPPSV
jgi:hypothetical protein